MPKDELAGKKTGLAEQKLLDGTQEKKRRDYHLWKKEQATQEDYKDVVRFWRMKIRRDEVQLELNLYTIKNISMYTVAKKKGGAENLPPFLYVVEHIAKG